MIPAEGRVVILSALIAEPVELCLFIDGPEANDDNATNSDFVEPQHYTPHTLQRRDWALDEVKAEIASDRVKFAFTGPAGKITGWLVRTKRARNVLAFDRLKDPVPINSNEDTVTVRARLNLRSQDVRNQST